MAIKSLNEKPIYVDSIINFSNWRKEWWTKEYRYHYYAFFPSTNDNVEGKNSSAWKDVICLIKSDTNEKEVNKLYNYRIENSFYSSAFLFVSGYWQDPEDGVVKAFNKRSILGHLQKRWTGDDVEYVELKPHYYNTNFIEKLVKTGKWGLPAKHCTMGILADIPSARSLVNKYFNNPDVIKRNSSNEDWGRYMDLIPKAELQEVAAALGGFSSFAKMESRLNDK